MVGRITARGSWAVMQLRRGVGQWPSRAGQCTRIGPLLSNQFTIAGCCVMSEVPPLRVVVVDDHPAVREGLSAILEAETGIEVIGVADSGRGG